MNYTILFVKNYYVILDFHIINPEVFGLLDCYTSQVLIVCEGSSTTSPEDTSASICFFRTFDVEVEAQKLSNTRLFNVWFV